MHTRIQPDYGCFPLWSVWSDGLRNLDPRTLPLDAALAEALMDWAAEFDAILNQEYPPSSAFPSPAARASFVEQGRELAKQVARALAAGSEVTYFNITTGEFEPILVEPA